MGTLVAGHPFEHKSLLLAKPASFRNQVWTVYLRNELKLKYR